MSEYKYLDENGLTYYHSKIKTLLSDKVDKVTGKGLSTNDYTTTEKNKLNGIASGAEVNQNAFGKVVVDTTTIEADAKVDTLTLSAGSNVTLTPNSANDTIQISATDTTYNDATTTTHGLMSVADKNTLDDLYNLIAGATAIGDSSLEQYEWSASKTYGNAEVVIYENNVYESGSIEGVTPTPGTFIPDEWFHIDLGGITLWDHKQLKGINEQLAQFVQTIQQIIQQMLQQKADINSPTLTGTPKAPTATAGTNTTQIATTAFVKTAVDNAVAGITGIEFVIVQSLPTTGQTGKIYLVPNSGSAPNIYDEYIWITSTSKFEKIGTTDVDLSGYVQKTEMVTITNAEIDTIVA